MKASPDKARKLLKQHFGKITSEEFETNLREHSPEIFEKAVTKREGLLEGKFDAEQQVFVFPTPPSPLPLSAYIATALTGLSEEAKELIIHLSDVVADICREVDIDLGCLKTPFLGSIFCPVFGPANIAYSACFYWS